MSIVREVTLLLIDTFWSRCPLCGRRKGYGHVGHQVRR